MKKRILLLNTPFYRLMGSHYNGLSLGILYIAAVLREDGHEVGVLNADYENRTDYLDQKGIFEGFNLYKRIHEDNDNYIWKDTVKKILEFNPDFIGISMYTANFKAAKILAEKVKQGNKEIKIVVGGVHPTLSPKDVLQSEVFDYIIQSEGEFSFLQLVNDKPKEGIPGLGYRVGEKMFINPLGEPLQDLDLLPFPARDLIINPSENMDYGQLITGRGCPFSCTYCASPAMWNKKKVRFRSVDNVLQELILIKDKYPHNIIYFFDDTFSIKKSRTIELCKKIIDSGINIQWKCDTRADCLTEEVIRLMKESGCVCIKIGVESGSEKILQQIDKRTNKEKIRNAVRSIKENDIPLTAYLMAGFPGETDEDLKETIEFAREIDANYYSLSIVAPYYGTKIHDDFVKNNGELGKEHWEYFYHQSREMILNDKLSEEIVEEFLSLNEGRKRI